MAFYIKRTPMVDNKQVCVNISGRCKTLQCGTDDDCGNFAKHTAFQNQTYICNRGSMAMVRI